MTDLFGEVQTMKVLSLWQPWASLAGARLKLHETRHWTTAYRGPLAIHAAKTVDLAGAPDDLCNAGLGRNWRFEVPRGAIVAVGRLAACKPAERVAGEITRADLAAGNFAQGRFAWRLDDVRMLKAPIPMAGRQGLFNWTPPADLDAQLGPAIDHAAACRYIGWA